MLKLSPANAGRGSGSQGFKSYTPQGMTFQSRQTRGGEGESCAEPHCGLDGSTRAYLGKKNPQGERGGPPRHDSYSLG